MEDDSKAFLHSTDTNVQVHGQKGKAHEPDTRCGVGGCSPGVLQKCSNMASFTAFYSLAGISTSALSMYVNSQITTLERHFNFSSSVSGVLMSCNDFGYLLTTLLVSYYTRRVHIPRALALSTMVYGVSGLLCTIAFFGTRNQIPTPPTGQISNLTAAPPPKPGLLCETASSQQTQNATCGERSQLGFDVSEGWRDAAIGIIGVGMVIQGMAKSPRHPFLGTYVDDNVPKTRTTFYLGIMTGLSIFGPALAFTLGGVFTKVYVTLEDTSLTPRDPRWVGAWWLGFLLFGVLGLLSGTPLFCFPRRMNKGRNIEAYEKKEKSSSENVPRVITEFKGLVTTYHRVLQTPILLLHILGTGLTLLSVSGATSFMPKYFETQFGLPAWKSNMIVGALNVSSASIGTVIGGWLTSRFKLGPLACLRLVLAASAVSGIVGAASLLTGCEQPVIYKGDTVMGASTISLNPAPCVAACECRDEAFFPTCGSDGRNYYSPCHAGCVGAEGATKFTNCSCILTNVDGRNSGQASAEQHHKGSAEAGLCKPDCGNLYPFISLMFVGAFISTLVIMPGFVVIIRSVPESDKPLAIGLNAFCGVCLGWFPGPVLFGALVDTTCQIWQTTCHGGRGACALYDIELFRNRFYGAVVGLKVLTLVFQTAAVLYATYSKKQVFQPHNDQEIVHNGPTDITDSRTEKHLNIPLTQKPSVNT